MPTYNLICTHCRLDKEEFATYTEFLEHNSSSTAVVCPKCGKKTAFYSLSHLKENLKMSEKDVMNFYSPGEQEKWFRGFEDLGKR